MYRASPRREGYMSYLVPPAGLSSQKKTHLFFMKFHRMGKNNVLVVKAIQT